jgi:hypothetical protein
MAKPPSNGPYRFQPAEAKVERQADEADHQHGRNHQVVALA